ncbi:MAG TPA: DNA recombination/repair protein RecA, partial [Tissierellales bacterium]|nr:DNA recombination/repair protein RecA [Tissierellales bacterium]
IMFGNPETTTGGRALKFYSSVRIDIRRFDSIKQGDNILGNRTRVRVVKNKVAPPFKKAEFDIMYGTVISKEGNILDVGVEADIIKKAGSWYSYEEHKLGQGRENAKDFLIENPEVSREVENKIREYYGLKPGNTGIDKNKVNKKNKKDKEKE